MKPCNDNPFLHRFTIKSSPTLTGKPKMPMVDVDVKYKKEVYTNDCNIEKMLSKHSDPDL